MPFTGPSLVFLFHLCKMVTSFEKHSSMSNTVFTISLFFRAKFLLIRPSISFIFAVIFPICSFYFNEFDIHTPRSFYVINFAESLLQACSHFSSLKLSNHLSVHSSNLFNCKHTCRPFQIFSDVTDIYQEEQGTKYRAMWHSWNKILMNWCLSFYTYSLSTMMQKTFYQRQTPRTPQALKFFNNFSWGTLTKPFCPLLQRYSRRMRINLPYNFLPA